MRPMKILLVLLSAIFIFLNAPCAIQAQEQEKLLKIVVLSRHGVRAPTQNAKTLSLWSQKTWPEWPVARGDLTPRGARLVTGMWSNLKDTLNELDILPKDMCPPPTSIFVRADVDERTKATARAILDGLAPDCSLGFAVMDEKVDPLFHPVKAGLYRFNPIPTAVDVLSMTDGGLENLQEDFAGTLSLLERISGAPSPSLCTRFTMTPNCQIADLPNAISVSSDGTSVRLVGSLDIASSMAEIFLLEYGEWPDVSAGWGQVNETILSQLMPVHSKIFDVINRAPLVSWARGSSLLTEMTAALFGEHYDKRCNDANLVIFVGHDTNIANIGGLLGLNWKASSYPQNGIPPAGALFLELWENQGKKYVKARFYAQPMKTLHAKFPADGKYTDFAPAPATVTAPPVVGEARFEINNFINMVEHATEGAPIAPRQMPPLYFGEINPKPAPKTAP